jgi:hypothetical protein
MSGQALRREYALARFPIKMSQRWKAMVYNQTGWNNSALSLTFAFALNGFYYSLGGGAFAAVGFDNTAYLYIFAFKKNTCSFVLGGPPLSFPPLTIIKSNE